MGRLYVREKMTHGKLFVIATPIGNLGDITFRAVETLKFVDFIICEDTRVTSILLHHFEISKPLVVINAHNESKSLERVVERIPGLNAAIMALSISGLPTDSFAFEVFLPQKKGRQKKLQQLAEEERTIVLYESTYRIEKLLEELRDYMPLRQIVVGRELTKKFEETWRGTAEEILTDFEKKNTKGEFVVIIAPPSWKKVDSES